VLSPRYVVFTTVESTLLHPASGSWSAALEGLEALNRQGIPVVLSSRGTRAQLEPFRRKILHGHPFLTESGAGLFIPDGYFSLRLEGATRVGRHFSLAFARPHAEAAAAVAEIAAAARASVVALSQLSVREIARNTGESPREADLSRQREFSELFFFAGEAEKAARRFSETARRKSWETVPGDPFWELRSRVMRNGQPAAGYLMDLYRRSLRVKLRSVGIGSQAEDAHLLSAMDTAVVLPRRAGEWDSALISRLPRAVRGEQAGPAGWSQAVSRMLQAPQFLRR